MTGCCEAGLAGVARDAAVRAERLRGELPPGALGDAVVTRSPTSVEALVTGRAGLRAGAAEALDVAVDLPGGARLAGTVPGVHGDRLVRVVYSRLGAKHRLRAWVHLLRAGGGAHGPGLERRDGRPRRRRPGHVRVSPRPDRTRRRARLAELVAVYRARAPRARCRCRRRPSCAYAEKRAAAAHPRPPARLKAGRASGAAASTAARSASSTTRSTCGCGATCRWPTLLVDARATGPAHWADEPHLLRPARPERLGRRCSTHERTCAR